MVKIDNINFAEPVFGEDEKNAVNNVMLGKWLASGRQNEEFENEFSEYIGTKYAVCVNSGSSANLLALAALGLDKGEKVITSACGFPATLSPILHLGMVPVLVDYEIPTHNIDVDQVVDAIRHSGAKALILAHTMGNPVDMYPIIVEAEKHGVKVIEDCCEALGATYYGLQVGAIGDIGTYSFYPSHQITALGGGGMVVCRDREIFNRLRSLRDWGKMSNWDKYEQNNTAYTMNVDGVPYFPHYVYETVGFNMKLPEANAAFGRVQLKRVDEFVQKRFEIHQKIAESITHSDTILHKSYGAPSWFGVVITLKKGNRDKLGDHLESFGIRHRPFFAGNITRHPPFSRYKDEYPVADFLMKQSLFVGCHPAITEAQSDYMIEHINNGIQLAQE